MERGFYGSGPASAVNDLTALFALRTRFSLVYFSFLHCSIGD
jgi:hypothetical protein